MITGLYAGLLALWLAFLLLRVVRCRYKYRVGLGVSRDGASCEELERAVRVHGNFTEIVPLILILMLLLEMQNIPLFLIHIFGVLLCVSRVSHWIGLSRSDGASVPRFIGTVLPVLMMIGGGGLLIFTYLSLIL